MSSHLPHAIPAAAREAVKRHLEWIFRLTFRHPGKTFGVCCIIFLASCVFITKIHFETDIFKMFPRKGPLSLFLDAVHWTGSAGNAYFLLEGERGKVVAEAEIFANKLKSLQVEGVPAFAKVSYRIFDPEEANALARFVGYAVVRPQAFVSPQDVEQYRRLLAPEAVNRSLQRAQAELAVPGALTGLVAADPLYLRDLVLPRLRAASQTLDLDPSSPYFLSRDGRVLIIIAEPSRPVTDLPFARKLVTAVNDARRGASVSITVTGAHLSAVTDEAVLKKEVTVGVISSLFIVLALFYVAYRRILPTVLIPVILLYGIVLAVAVGGLIYPTLSIISFAFASLIVGIGTDYTIHLYDRFHFERSLGHTTDEALQLATVDTGRALFTAGVTTAIPFLALVLSDVQALAELGLLVGLGVIFSLYATLLFLPPLLLFMDKRFPLGQYRPLPTFGLRWAWRWGRKHAKGSIGCGLAAVVGLLVAARGISFESELKNLQPRSSEAFLTQEKLERHLSVSPRQMIVAVEGGNLTDVMTRGSRIAAAAEAFRGKGEVVSCSSLSGVINDPTAQEQVIAALAAPPALGEVRSEVAAALTRNGFATEMLAGYLDGLSTLPHLSILPQEEAIGRLADSPFRGLVARHFIHNAAGYHLLTYVNYRGEDFHQGEFIKTVRSADPTCRVTSVDLVSQQLTESVRHSFRWAVMLGSVLVLFLLLSHFNSFAGIFYSLAPLASGVVAMLGIMALIGMKLNFMNVMVLVTIIGMGSDYGLHIAHRIRNCHSEECEERFVQSARAVLLSGVTTIAGFGSLALTDYGAMASIGWTTNLGVLAITLFTMCTLPAWTTFVGTGKET